MPASAVSLGAGILTLGASIAFATPYFRKNRAGSLKLELDPGYETGKGMNREELEQRISQFLGKLPEEGKDNWINFETDGLSEVKQNKPGRFDAITLADVIELEVLRRNVAGYNDAHKDSLISLGNLESRLRWAFFGIVTDEDDDREILPQNYAEADDIGTLIASSWKCSNEAAYKEHFGSHITTNEVSWKQVWTLLKNNDIAEMEHLKTLNIYNLELLKQYLADPERWPFKLPKQSLV